MCRLTPPTRILSSRNTWIQTYLQSDWSVSCNRQGYFPSVHFDCLDMLSCFLMIFWIAFFTEVYVSSPPQVNLSQCTKPVEPGLRPLCDQSMYLSESPASSYKKTLCCDSCKRKSSHLRLYVGLGGAGAFILLLSLVAVIAFRWVAARSPVRRMKEGAPLILLIV